MKTLYINNLNEKVSLNTLKRELDMLLKPYPVDKIHLSKSLRKKGQAFISFDRETSTKIIDEVIKKYHNYKLLDKVMNVTEAKQDAYELLSPEEIESRKNMKLYKQSGPVNKVLILKEIERPSSHQNQDNDKQVDYESLLSLFSPFEGFENLRYIKSRKISLIEFKTPEDSEKCFQSFDTETLKQLNSQLSYAKN